MLPRFRVIFLNSFRRLPWKVTAVMLADTVERYKEREKRLISEFKRIHQIEIPDDGIVQWVERIHPRRYILLLDFAANYEAVVCVGWLLLDLSINGSYLEFYSI